MKTNGKNLNTFFSILKDVRPTKPGLTHEEIQNILGSAPMTGSTSRRNIFNRRTGMAAIIGSILFCTAAFYMMQDNTVQNTPIQKPQLPASMSVATQPAHPAAPEAHPAATDNSMPQRSVRPDAVGVVRRAEYHPFSNASFHDSRSTTVITDASVNNSLAPSGEPCGPPFPQDSTPPLLPPLRPLPPEAPPVHFTTISSTRILELTEEEMVPLNITMRGNQLEVYGEEKLPLDNPKRKIHFYKLGFDTTQSTVTCRQKVSAGIGRIESKALPYTPIDTFSKLVPIIVSSDKKMERMESSSLVFFDHSPLLELFVMDRKELDTSMFRDNSPHLRLTDERNSMLASKLIPIRIRPNQTETDIKESGRGEYTLWYFPTEEFVAALPDRYRIPLREELKLIADVEQHTITSSEVCQRLTGETFFDYCRRNSGTLALASVYPNPTKGDITCRFSLKSGRTLSFALYDIYGKHLRNLTEPQWMEPGDHNVNMNVKETGSGAYLVVIKTDQGEQVVQRVIVE